MWRKNIPLTTGSRGNPLKKGGRLESLGNNCGKPQLAGTAKEPGQEKEEKESGNKRGKENETGCKTERSRAQKKHHSPFAVGKHAKVRKTIKAVETSGKTPGGSLPQRSIRKVILQVAKVGVSGTTGERFALKCTRASALKPGGK